MSRFPHLIEKKNTKSKELEKDKTKQIRKPGTYGTISKCRTATLEFCNQFKLCDGCPNE